MPVSTAREEEFHPGTLKTSGHAPSWPPHLHCCHSSIPPSLAPFSTTCPGYGHPPFILKSTCTVLLPCQNSFLLYQIQTLNCLQASSVPWPSLSLPPQASPCSPHSSEPFFLRGAAFSRSSVPPSSDASFGFTSAVARCP